MAVAQSMRVNAMDEPTRFVALPDISAMRDEDIDAYAARLWTRITRGTTGECGSAPEDAAPSNCATTNNGQECR